MLELSADADFLRWRRSSQKSAATMATPTTPPTTPPAIAPTLVDETEVGSLTLVGLGLEDGMVEVVGVGTVVEERCRELGVGVTI